MVTSDYELSDLDNIEFFWETPRFETDTVFRLGLDTSFILFTMSVQRFGNGRIIQKPIMLDEEEDKEVFLQTLQSLSVQQKLPCCSRVVPPEDGLEKRQIVHGIVFHYVYLYVCVIINKIN